MKAIEPPIPRSLWGSWFCSWRSIAVTLSSMRWRSWSGSASSRASGISLSSCCRGVFHLVGFACERAQTVGPALQTVLSAERGSFALGAR